jgi:hypothetical protein
MHDGGDYGIGIELHVAGIERSPRSVITRLSKLTPFSASASLVLMEEADVRPW